MDLAAAHRSFRSAVRLLEAARAESVRGYLERGRHIREVARSAHVHVGIVRYRLRRFVPPGPS
ncbi:hypothetical protein [Streptomyces sp. KR55]|uniref:hypothetical protein n=1 Tax=Streptomyces sp. KR55 TaxID=3457425 RepID=UPI003FCF8CD7